MDKREGFVLEEVHRDDPYHAEHSSAAAAGLAGESMLDFDSAGNASLQGELAPQSVYKVHTPTESAHSGISGSRYDVLMPKPLRGSAAALGSTVQHYKVGASYGRLGDPNRDQNRLIKTEDAADALQAVIGPSAASAGGPVPSAPGSSSGAVIELHANRDRGRATDGSNGGQLSKDDTPHVRWADQATQGETSGARGGVVVEKQAGGAGASSRNGAEQQSEHESKDSEPEFELSGEHADVLGVVFQFLDEDCDGELSDDQLRYAVTAMGIPPTWPFLQEIKSHCVEGQGVSYPLLKSAIENRTEQQPINCARLDALFSGFASPACGPGEVPTHLLRYLLSGVHTAYGTQLSDGETDQLLDHLRIREGERVHAVDFVRALSSGFLKMVPGSEQDVAPPPPSSREQRSDMARRRMERVQQAAEEKEAIQEKGAREAEEQARRGAMPGGSAAEEQDEGEARGVASTALLEAQMPRPSDMVERRGTSTGASARASARVPHTIDLQAQAQLRDGSTFVTRE